MESIFGYSHPLAITLVLQFLLFCSRGNCTSSNCTILTPDNELCFETIDIDIIYSPFTLVDEEAGIQFRILRLRPEDKPSLYSIDATLRTANSEERCMLVCVDDSDDVILKASNPISGFGKANTFVEIALDVIRNETITSLSANYSESFGTPLNSVMFALVSTAPCLVDENKFSVNVSVQESQSFETSGDSISDFPIQIDLQLLSEFSTWALQLDQNTTEIHTALLTRTAVVTPTPMQGLFGIGQTIRPTSNSVHRSLRPSQTPVPAQPSPNPDESKHRLTIALGVAVGVIAVVITAFVAVVTWKVCCPQNRNKHMRILRESANVPSSHDYIEETFQARRNAAYNTMARNDTSLLHDTNRLHRPAQLPHSRPQGLGNVSYHIYEEIPTPSEIIAHTEFTGSRNGNRREVRVRSLSESQLYATPYRRNRLPVPTRATSVSGSSGASGAYATLDNQLPVTAAAALSRILLKAPAASTVRQPVSQDTIPEEELELEDEEDGMEQNSTTIQNEQNSTTIQNENEYLVLCQ